MPWATEISDIELYRPQVVRFLSLLPNVNTSRAAGSLPIFRKEYRSTLQHWLHCSSVLGAKLTRRILTREQQVFPGFNYNSMPGLRLVWKSINSMGRLGVFLRVAGHCKAIVILRHPCGVIASVKRGVATGNLRSDHSEDYGLFEKLVETDAGKPEGLTVNDLRQMKPEERLA